MTPEEGQLLLRYIADRGRCIWPDQAMDEAKKTGQIIQIWQYKGGRDLAVLHSDWAEVLRQAGARLIHTAVPPRRDVMGVPLAEIGSGDAMEFRQEEREMERGYVHYTPEEPWV